MKSDSKFFLKSFPVKPALFNEGRFRIDRDNTLIYSFNKVFSYKEFALKKKVKFKGRWSLDTKHNLVLGIEKQYKNLRLRRIVFNTSLIDYDKEGLLFTIKRKISDYRERIELLKLRGRFSVDRFNRIIFEVSKREPDILVFRGAWDINKSNQIIYNYQDLEKKKRISFQLRGYWQVGGKNKLVYVLERSLKERLEFKVRFQSLNLYPKKGVLKYSLGVGFKKQRRKRIISFYGTLKVSRRGGLFLEFDTGLGKKAKFGFNLNFTKRGKMICSLFREEGKPLGISLVFQKNTPHFNYFLRLTRKAKIKKVGAGATFNF